jgi:hypothetical protein
MIQRLKPLGLFLIVLFSTFNTLWGQEDSMKNILKSFVLKDKFEEVEIKIDTSVEMFQIYKIIEKNSISSSNLGNIGTADLSNIYIYRTDNFKSDFLFNLPYALYQIQPENIQYYNTRRPYTDILYTTATKIKDEQTINFTHTQNVNPRLNVGFNYRLILSLGEYPNQSTRNNTFSFHTSYTGDKYRAFGSFSYNKFKQQENGGIIDTGSIPDINSLESYLSDASSKLMSRTVFLTQKFRFGKYKSIKINDSLQQIYEPLISIGHNISYNLSYRTYSDRQDAGKMNYYTQYYYSNLATNDSASLSNLENSLRLQSEARFNERFKFGFSLMFTNQQKQYFNFKDYIRTDNTQYYSDNSVSATMFSNRQKNLQVDISANYFMSGYRMGDYLAQVDILKKINSKNTSPFFIISLKTHRKKPSYFLQYYYSNHFRWENQFDAEYTLAAEANFKVPQWFLEIGFNSQYIRNFVNFETNVVPVQNKKEINVMTGYVSKNFNLGRWHTQNKVYWQKTSAAQSISIPEWALFHSSYLELKYKKALKTDVGFDLYYTSSFKAYNYNPAAGQFYLDANSQILAGDYPHGSVFINALINQGRVLMFIKFEHINSGFLKDIYYSTAHYPINSRMFKLGVRWTFPN